MTFTLEELAHKLGATLEGDGGQRVSGLCEVGQPQEGKLCLVGTAEASRAFGQLKGHCLLTTKEFCLSGCHCLVVEDFRPAMAAVLSLFAPSYPPRQGHHPTACIFEGAQVSPQAYVGPYCVVEAGAKVAPGAQLVAHVYLGRDVTVGEDTVLESFVSLGDSVTVGRRCHFFSGVCIGADGFGFVPGGSKGQNLKVPQIGSVVIGDDVEIGANSCVDRGALGNTVIGDDTKIDNLVQIGHGVKLGSHLLIASQAGVAGSTTVGDGTIIAAKAGLKDHINVGSDVVVFSKAGVTKDVESRAQVSGFPAQAHRDEVKTQAALRRLPEALKQLKTLAEVISHEKKA